MAKRTQRSLDLSDVFVFLFWLVVGGSIVNFLFLLLAYDWRTYAVLGIVSVAAYLWRSAGRWQGPPHRTSRSMFERTPFEAGSMQRGRRVRDGWEE
jgi:hypothetical protein